MPPPVADLGRGRKARREHQLERVAHPERHALEHRPGEVGATVVDGQADERTAGEGIGVRRALTREIRKEQEAIAPRRRLGGFLDELLERDAWSERIPAQAPCRREHHAHQVPSVRQGVAERMSRPSGSIVGPRSW